MKEEVITHSYISALSERVQVLHKLYGLPKYAMWTNAK